MGGRFCAQKNQFTARVPAGTREGLAEAGIDLIAGSARFQDRETLQVNGRQLKAPFFVLATGARPMPLPIEGFPHLITSDDFLELDTLPPKILFVGGGFISFEFAHFAARLGPPGGRIVILEVEARPLGPFDADMVDLLVKASAEAGIEVHTGVRIEAVTPLNGVVPGHDCFRRIVRGRPGGPRCRSGCRRSTGLDLEAGGVAYSAKGIEVDARLRTANPRVFAVGDCIASPQLARVADLEAQVAAENILAERSHAPTGTMDYRAVPSILFTYPQYGMVGQTEQALKRQGIPYTRSFAHNLQWPTYTRVGLNHAAYKILVGADRGILGGHLGHPLRQRLGGDQHAQTGHGQRYSGRQPPPSEHPEPLPHPRKRPGLHAGGFSAVNFFADGATP